MSTANTALSIESTTVVVSAVVTAAHFQSIEIRKKRVDKEESHGNVFDVRCKQFIYVLALFILGVNTK
jgi:hypothetical protein